MSAKPNNHQGRRTPLSLSAGNPKGAQNHNQKGGSNNTNNSGHQSNGHSTNNHNKHDNKHQQQNAKSEAVQSNQSGAAEKSTAPPTEIKEVTVKLQKKEAITESKIPKLQQQDSSEEAKNQKQQSANANGVSSSTSNSKDHNTKKPQQQQNNNADKNKEQKNGHDKKSNEKEIHSVSNQRDKNEEKSKSQDKSEIKEAAGPKAKNSSQENAAKADEKALDDKKKAQTSNEDAKEEKTNAAAITDASEKKPQQMEVVVESSSPKPSKKETKTLTPKKAEKTPTNEEKTPQKPRATRREVTTAIDDVEMMEPLEMEASPKKPAPEKAASEALAPCATSTPGKVVLARETAKTDVQLAMQSTTTPDRPRAFSQISGRRTIRPLTEYTPSKFQSNSQFRESYRRINTELDATNTSLNVTVGSEVPNNASFSFFGRSRKRDRVSPQPSQSAIGEIHAELETSPPKRARLDFFSVVSSPLAMLRNRFSRTTLQSSTPNKQLQEKEDDIEVQNVSGVSDHEELGRSTNEEVNAEASIAAEAKADITISDEELDINDSGVKALPGDIQDPDGDDIKITESPLHADVGGKNKRCLVM